MLTDYIHAAMRHAHYEIMEDGRYWGDIPVCKGVWAEAKTLEACREELRSVLEDWLLLGFQFGDPIPPVDGINLNRSSRRRDAAAAQIKSKGTTRRRVKAHA